MRREFTVSPPCLGWVGLRTSPLFTFGFLAPLASIFFVNELLLPKSIVCGLDSLLGFSVRTIISYLFLCFGAPAQEKTTSIPTAFPTGVSIAPLLEPFGALRTGVVDANSLKDMVGPWGLEPQTSTVSIARIGITITQYKRAPPLE
ncbi:MAG: hypothetical protein DMG54_02670 [Acidobacteria bacterium]|nr:MAG: hypothetical protein DMG54_02670 [Acidobacteriota bacterium]